MARLAGGQTLSSSLSSLAARAAGPSGACTCQGTLWGGDGDPEPCPVHAAPCYDANNCCAAGQSQDCAADEARRERRDQRYALLERLSRITVHPEFAKRVAVCQHPIPGQVVVKSRDGTAFPACVSTCGSMFCPVCAPKIRARRAEDFGDAVAGWLRRGLDHDAWMVRLSARNTVDLPEKEAVDRALKGWARLRNRRAWRNLAERYGLHYIRALEQTHGENGWNVHLHVVFATRAADPALVLAHLALTLRRLWPDVMASLGFYADPRAAVHVQQVDAATAAEAGGYLAKASAWGVGDEIARGDLKLGKLAGRTYEQVLADYDRAPNPVDLALIREHHDALWGRRQFSWSRGFRELLGMKEELSDDQAAAEVESPDDEEIAVIDGRTYYTMLRRRQVGALLDCAETGGLAKVYAFVVDTLGYPPGSVVAPRPDLTRRQPLREARP